jgi:hypothetical protein
MRPGRCRLQRPIQELSSTKQGEIQVLAIEFGVFNDMHLE